MASEPAPKGDRSALERLTELLTAASDTAPTPRELAELLWLARQLPGPEDPAEPARSAEPPARTTTAARAGAEEGAGASAQQPSAAPGPSADRPGPPGPPPAPSPRVPLRLPARAPHPSGERPLLAPAPAMLPRPLALQRALRPLKRTAPSARARLLDERATADRIARLDAHPDVWLPVLRPARDRWLRLALVHDTGPTMPVWRPLVRELHTVLAQSGVFRTVTLHPATPDGRARHVSDTADGRTVTLIVSDCMGPQWRPGPAGDRWHATLRHWAARMPLAVVQPLPERLWPTTALPAQPGLLTSPAPAAPLSALRFTPYDPEAEPPPAAALPLPVLEPGAPWLANWAALVAGPGGARTPGAAAWLTTAPAPSAEREAPDPAALPAQDLVLRFRATASPEAFRLAGHLALALPSVPVMRLVQRAVNRDPRPQHLAEVILSGMLTTAPGPPGSYDFRPGVRELLLRTLPRTTRGRARELLDRVGALIDERAGLTTGEFRAEAAPAGPGADAAVAHPAFATVSEETVRRLGGRAAPDTGLFAGRYRLGGKVTSEHSDWQSAQDTWQDDATVLVRGYPRAPGWLLAEFDDVVRRLRLIRHPGVAAIRDHGFADGVPYLVREFVEGENLNHRLRTTRHGLPATELVALVPALAATVTALHELGRPIGGLNASQVIVSPRGPVLTCLDPLRFGTGSRADDLRALGRLVHAMHRGSDRPTGRQLTLPDPGLSLPERLSATLDAAVADLASDDDDVRLRGVDRLLHVQDAFREHGRGTAEPREPHPVPGGTDRSAPAPDARPVLRFETDTDLAARPEARITLELAVHEVLARGDLTPQQYEIGVRGSGYHVEIQPGAYLLPVLAAALRWLPGPLADLSEPPRLRVTFQDGPLVAAPPQSAAPVLLTVPPALYDDFALSSAAAGPHRFHPLYGDAPDGPPLAWYCPLPAPRAADEGRELVRGPLLTRDLGQLGIPEPGRTAIVHTRPDGPLTQLNPADPYGGRPPRPATYYEVDLVARHAVHRISLPSSGKGEFTAAVELTWRVADPVAFVRAQSVGVAELLLAHLREAGARITRHHSVRRAAGAQRAVNAQLGGWPVPGLAVTCAVTLAPDYAPPPETPHAGSARPLEELLAGAETVLFGFDGPLTRLFTAAAARAAALDLLSLVAEHRDPEDAFAGRPPGDPGAAGRELFVHPLDVLRAFARDPLGPLLRDRLAELELEAVPDAPTTHHSVALVRTLHAAGRRVGVATDVCEGAVRRHLEFHRLALPAGVHGRADDLGLLMPNPQGLLRALRPLGTPAAGAVLIGSSPAELTAARAAGLRFVGLARNPTAARSLTRAGGDVTVPSLTPVLEAARAL
ncbi:SAV_2336 N-terminal domain-related protein [Streptomyces sp. B21-097]